MQLPSNKVGLVLIGVVLVSSVTIFFSKYQKPEEFTDLQNVNILIARNTDNLDRTTDIDEDGLLDWQEDLYRTDPYNPDTDGDGTPDGEEIALKRDPTVAGPNDPLITSKDYFDMDFEERTVATGTPTQKLSVDLASEYFLLKKNNQLTPEKESQLVTQIAQKAVANAQIINKYTVSDLITVSSSKETVKKYGSEFAQTSLEYYREIDSYKNLSENLYMPQIGQVYADYAKTLSNMSVPTIAIDVHLKIINNLDQTSTLLQKLTDSSSDPVTVMVLLGHQQEIAQGDLELYTSLSSYFTENGIIFDDTEVIRFWDYFAN